MKAEKHPLGSTFEELNGSMSEQENGPRLIALMAVYTLAFAVLLAVLVLAL